jgi:Tfp pilus assembly protein PilF
MNMQSAAQRMYRKRSIQEPSFTPSYFQQGYIKQFLQQPTDIDSAMFFYNVTLDREPTYVEAWHNLGLCYVVKGDKTRALQSFSKALKYDPEFTLAREEAEKLR